MPLLRRRSNRASAFRERIAGIGRSAIEAAPEPARSIRRRPVRERLGSDAAPRHLLELVVADGGSGAQALLDVAGLEHLALGGGMAPHARQTVRLQLDANGKHIALGGIALGELLHAIAQPEHVLDVMAD